ncbi:hypothetical protein QFZ22_001233 [Streptomyces canus]|uniref:VOC domain-containing protein n=1 Tax=Streptomyces canus TaxID=58343 RepID=A0AAW8F601_9ACTN|nr:hypothetical protein [Streptomyces canus]MDQ0905248.1 hypothetical protein [Streptomyces canus]
MVQRGGTEVEIEELQGTGVEIVRPLVKAPWGLIKMWIADPDGTRIVLVEVPADHPIGYRPGIRPQPGRCSQRRSVRVSSRKPAEVRWSSAVLSVEGA